MFVVDTNILLYAAIEEFDEHSRARELVDAWRKDPFPWGITWPTVYEFLRVCTHTAVFERPLSLAEAWKFLRATAEAPGFSFLLPTPRHRDVLDAIVKELPGLRGNILHDVHIAALMREHGIEEIRTADTDFNAFRFLRVVNPL